MFQRRHLDEMLPLIDRQRLALRHVLDCLLIVLRDGHAVDDVGENDVVDYCACHHCLCCGEYVFFDHLEQSPGRNQSDIYIYRVTLGLLNNFLITFPCGCHSIRVSVGRFGSFVPQLLAICFLRDFRFLFFLFAFCYIDNLNK